MLKTKNRRIFVSCFWSPPFTFVILNIAFFPLSFLLPHLHIGSWLTQTNEAVYYVLFVHVFYRAMLCIRGTSHGPVSVCLSVSLCPSVSVTSRSSTKTAKRRIIQTTPHDSPETLVFWCQRSPRNSTGVTPYEGAECRWGCQNRRLSTNNRLYLENSKR